MQFHDKHSIVPSSPWSTRCYCIRSLGKGEKIELQSSYDGEDYLTRLKTKLETMDITTRLLSTFLYHRLLCLLLRLLLNTNIRRTLYVSCLVLMISVCTSVPFLSINISCFLSYGNLRFPLGQPLRLLLTALPRFLLRCSVLVWLVRVRQLKRIIL